jgi:hypothetical protein
MTKPTKDPVLEELGAIKKLLMLALYASGVPSEEIDKAVKMGPANIRAMFSKKRSRISVLVSKQEE